MSEQINAKKIPAQKPVTPIEDYFMDRVIQDSLGTKTYLSPTVGVVATIAGGLVATGLLVGAVAMLQNRNR